MHELQISKKFREDERFLNIRDRNLISLLALKTLQLIFESSSVMLDDYHYCPSFMMNVIFVGLLAKLGYKFIIKDDFCDIIVNDTTIMRRQLKHSIYIISRSFNVMYTVSKRPKLDNVSESYLWHYRLGHVNKNRIDRLIKEYVFEIDDCELLPTYKSYLLGKMTKSPFKEKGERASDVLGLIHTDVCGPMNISAR